MAGYNSITGDQLISRPNTKAFEDNFDAIFRPKVNLIDLHEKIQPLIKDVKIALDEELKPDEDDKIMDKNLSEAQKMVHME